MIKCEVRSSPNTEDMIMVFTISQTELLTNKGIMNLSRDEIYQRIISEVSQDYLKKNKEMLIAKIDTKELANLVKNKISLEVIENFKKKDKPKKIEKPYCDKGCPDQIENLKSKRLPGHKRSKPVDPELCYERQKYRCRLIDK